MSESGAGRRPLVLAVDGEPGALERITDELQRYARDYTVVCGVSSESALAQLEALRAEGASVALVLAAEPLAGLRGSELLARVHVLHPHAKRALLIPWGGWGDEATAEAIRRAMALGHIDYYVLRPARTPDELFHRTVSEFLHEWSRLNAPGRREIALVADPWSPRGYELRNLLARNGVPHSFHASDTSEGRHALEEAGVAGADVPVVLLPGGGVLVDPSNAALARGYGVTTELASGRVFDVAIVGAGPAGLSAAVYASSEGLETLVVEREAIGGQAGSSSRIRNYLGFARGITGAELAQRAYQQAWVFGATFVLMREVTGLRSSDGAHLLTLSGETEAKARAVVLAGGVAYRRLGIPALDELTGSGVFYGASPTDGQQFAGGRVYVVGAGNSAGQAAVHLSRYALRVTVVVRGKALAASMSGYLETEVASCSNVEVLRETRVVGGGGDGRLEQLELEDATGAVTTAPADALFVLIGAEPRTGWLPSGVARDERGFVVTGPDFGTSVPGVFAIGDLRATSVKRVASAVGEGSVAIQHVHRYLDEPA